MTGKIDSHISIDAKETKRASDLEHCIRKRLTIDHLKLPLDTPFKLLDGKDVDFDETARQVVAEVDRPIFEIGRRVARDGSWNALHYLLQEAGSDKVSGLNDFFKLKKEMRESEQLTTLSVVFRRDPFPKKRVFLKEGKRRRRKYLDALSEEDYESLLDYLHEASRAYVLCPDVKIGEPGLSVKSYESFIDRNMVILDSYNQKPVFAPIQLDRPLSEIVEILEHYRANGYHNIWINLNGGEWCGPYFSNIRGFLRHVDRLYSADGKSGLNHVCLHYSHVKKESGSHPRLDHVLSSDILSQFFSGDFIGINQSKQAGGMDKKKEEERVEKLIESGQVKGWDDYIERKEAQRTRIFDPESYYYVNIEKYPKVLPIGTDVLKLPQINRLYNSAMLQSEIERTKNYLITKNNRIRPYIKGKKALKDNPGILNDLVPRGRPTRQTLMDELGRL